MSTNLNITANQLEWIAKQSQRSLYSELLPFESYDMLTDLLHNCRMEQEKNRDKIPTTANISTVDENGFELLIPPSKRRN